MDPLERAIHTVLFSTRASYGRDSARALSRRVERGEVVRLRRGAFTAQPNAAGSAAHSNERARHELLKHAVAVVGIRPSALALSHHSAAAAWELPISGRWPARVDVTAIEPGWSKSDAGVRVHHCLIDPAEWQLLAGLPLTSPGRTVFDLARSGAVDDAVVALDAAMRPNRATGNPLVTHDVLGRMVAAAPSSRGLAMARSALDFADPLSGSPGESCSRMAIYRAGFARPELQVRHASHRRSYYETDFEWPQHGVIGEFDGRGKYFKEDIDGQVDPGQAIYDEKLREDELRTQCRRLVRWGWREVRQPSLLRHLLLSAGIPLVRAPRHSLGAW